MKKNMNGMERLTRLILGAAFIILFMLKMAKNYMGVIALILGIILVLTSIIGYSPIYGLINSKDHKNKPEKK